MQRRSRCSRSNCKKKLNVTFPQLIAFVSFLALASLPSFFPRTFLFVSANDDYYADDFGNDDGYNNKYNNNNNNDDGNNNYNNQRDDDYYLRNQKYYVDDDDDDDDGYHKEQQQYQNHDDDVFQWSGNNGFNGVSVMPVSCIN